MTESGGGVVEKGGEGILGIEDEEPTLTLAVMLKRLRRKKKMGKGIMEGLERKDLIFGDRIEGQKGKGEEGKIVQRNGVGTRRLRSSSAKSKFEWKADKDGSIRCPPEHMEGCV
ncbi:uncharacterized protein LOC112192700 isoform X2 [Rosa chinensis]|uniref:uncharacterized protein LOC112192700 isoform X2 n=1 Tax=Rosa chinensis TaxID=74649 RepID=UPI001AD8B985|nr:uncharacterized protein LOC112192700 isoform X2 [Rosa chinensis]